MRDGNNSFYFNGVVQNSEKNKYTGTTKVTIKVDDPLLKDMNKCTLPPTGKLEVANKIYSYEEWQYDGGDTYTFTLTAESTASTTPPSERTAKAGADFEYQGIPYYMQQMNEWVRLFASAANEILTQPGSSDEYGKAGQILFTGNLDTILYQMIRTLIRRMNCFGVVELPQRIGISETAGTVERRLAQRLGVFLTVVIEL
jgi:flagellar hook-associated protein 1 FlgK